ncbi:MAG: hypothetical protein K5Q68_02250 [Roseococcus sp.]|nr:hypothetical protein [Roseococcus sp.]
MISRRTLLATQAAGISFSLAGGWVRPVRAQGGGPLAPWNVAAHADPRLAALAWGVLAPNPHNRQPWLMRLVGTDSILLHVDLDRRLPVTDPLDRQILIGLGCFTELLRLAAAQQGIAAEIAPFPEGEPQPRLDARPIARITFRGSATPDPLFAVAGQRRSAKQPYDVTREVAAPQIAALRAALLATQGFGAETGDVARLRDIAWRAWEIEANDRAAWMETVRLMRFGSAAVAAQPDGVSLWGPQMDPLVAAGQLTPAAMEPGQEGWRIGAAQYRAIFEGTNAFTWLVTPGNGRVAQFAAGRDWLRLNLAATAQGLALQPVSQGLQEFPAMAGPYRELHALLGQTGTSHGGTVQMLGRIGHPLRAAPPTPRWPMESRILAG